MKKQKQKLPDDFCLCCDMGMKSSNGTHTLRCHDYQKNTVTNVPVKCSRNN